MKLNLTCILLVAWISLGLSSMNLSYADESAGKSVEPAKVEAAEPLANVKVSGIGLVLTQDENSKKIIAKNTAPDSPASKMDIQPGDELVEIDGVKTSNSSLSDCGNKIRGKSGTKVTLTFLRGTQKLKFTIERGEFTIPLTHGACSPKKKTYNL